MTLPLIVLAVGALAAGWVGIPEGLTGGRIPNYFEHFLAPAVAGAPHAGAPSDHGPAQPAAPGGHATEAAAGHATDHTLEWILTGISSVIAVLGILIGWTWFKRSPLWQPPPLLENKYYVDEVYDATVVEPIKAGSTNLLWRAVDIGVIDGLVNGAGGLVRGAGGALRLIQTGATRSYAAFIGLAGLAVIGYFVYLALTRF